MRRQVVDGRDQVKPWPPSTGICRATLFRGIRQAHMRVAQLDVSWPGHAILASCSTT
jgi:hypothetical protein